MKAKLELTRILESGKSFNYFQLDVPRFTPFWHFHPELELTLITKGSGTRYVGNSIQPFQAYDLVLVGENLPHQWVSELDPEQSSAAYVIQFPRSIFTSLPECKAFDDLFERARYGLEFSYSDTMLIQFERLKESSEAGQVAILIAILDQLTAIDSDILSSVNYQLPSQNKVHFDRTESAIHYILDNLNRRLTVEEMAERTHMTTQSFCRWFKKATGNSFITFVNTSRIENACLQLRHTDKPVSSIAFDCGFESISQFNRTFKTIKGESPSSFRKL